MVGRVVIVLGLMAALAIPVSAQQKQQIGPVEITGYSEFTGSDQNYTFSGPRVYARTLDGKMETKAQKIVIAFGATGPRAGVGSLKSITLTGDVWVLSKPEPSRKTEATADRAVVDREKQEAVFTGNVKVNSVDPAMFAGPASVTGDKATVNLKPTSELKPGETRIRIESDPGKSRLQFTPLPPKRSEQGTSAR